MADDVRGAQGSTPGASLAGPPINPNFVRELDELVALGRRGHRQDCSLFNPPDQTLFDGMPVFQDMPPDQQQQALQEFAQIRAEGEEANSAGRAAYRAGPRVVVRLDNGGLAYYSQLGVVRRPDLTQYFIDGFSRNRDALAFSEENQALFTEVFACINSRLKEHLDQGKTIIQTDRQICDAPGRSFHARQLLFGDTYLQLPIMWRLLTFELTESAKGEPPDILEVSIPNWLDDLGLPEDLKSRLLAAGLTQLVFKAPTKGLSLHLGFDYMGEHKMGPLSIAMAKVKRAKGLAVQAALSVARAKTVDGSTNNTALVTIGPSLHGKSTLTIMIELRASTLAQQLGVDKDPNEGVYPMNDDIVLLQAYGQPVEVERNGKKMVLTHGIDGTENNFYAVPFGLTHEDDPITYDVLRGTPDSPNSNETLENVVVDAESGVPDYLQNPVRNMRMILSRPGLLKRKGVDGLIGAITGGRLNSSVHVPMEDTDRVFWQAVMRQNTIIPPLRRLSLASFVRVLMYGEAVQMGAAVGAIGRPYVEYFSDPFIIGLEDDNANIMHDILQEMEKGGQPQHYYVFNTGGVGADTNDEASGAKYKKIPRELTLMLQEALLRDAVRFEYDPVLRSDIAVGIEDVNGNLVLDLSQEWLPRLIYGDDDYAQRILDLRRRRYYGRDAEDKAGILRYTKVDNRILDINDIPPPSNERELSWLFSFYWGLDRAYNSIPELANHLSEGQQPDPELNAALISSYREGVAQGMELSGEGKRVLQRLHTA